MHDDRNNNIEAEDLELLDEIKRNTPDAVAASRAHTRLDINARVTVRPANASERHERSFVGVTGDISAGGCQLLLASPLTAGDLYLIEFDRAALEVAPVYARCMRCRVVREGAYESGFAFFSSVDLKIATDRRPEQTASLV